jgi:DTW domain-containing protein
VSRSPDQRAAKLASRCPRCLHLPQWCLCDEVPTVQTRTRVILVRHYREVTRSSNSGRLAALALPNSELLDHGAPGTPATLLDAAMLEGAALLFPGGEPLSAANPPAKLIVLDATWSQARRMRRKVRGLERIRTVSIPSAPTDRPRMRASPGEGKVSTIEAIAYALGELEGEAVRDPLLTLFEVAVARSRASGRMSPALGSFEAEANVEVDADADADVDVDVDPR